jgi:hypothetical protein
MKRKTSSCDEIQKRISDGYDSATDLDHESAEHIARCADCSAFLRHVTGLGELTNAVIESKIKPMRIPDFVFPLSRGTEKKTIFNKTFAWGIPLAGAFAAIILCAVFFFNAANSTNVAIENKVFVDTILEEPVLLDSEIIFSNSEMISTNFFSDTVLGDDYATVMTGLSDYIVDND